jgi:hypothetical protein
MAVPLSRAATHGKDMLEAPNILIFQKISRSVPADCVIESCCRSTAAAFCCLASGRHTSAEDDISSCWVNDMHCFKLRKDKTTEIWEEKLVFEEVKYTHADNCISNYCNKNRNQN